MVRSILDKSINYEEIRTLAEQDKNTDVDQYAFIKDDKEFILAIGLPQYSFEQKKNCFFSHLFN